ncbi:Fur family transcriptional regulator [Facilibium subflavum]|uniref:Fur family transcriptional regulator n=1 Tax=Facilibium subflavum TaxID=2219058 RepID=UPI000E64683A|nr:transcriptional repressor [Facilibium subflavum]
MIKLNDIKAYCLRHQIRLTPLRLKVIAALITQNQPISAYDLLAILKKDKPEIKIMSVYRVLDFLQSHHIAHKIDATHTYSLCCHPSDQLCQLFICQSCGRKFETHAQSVYESISKLADDKKFIIKQSKIELIGLCHLCVGVID